MQDFMDQPLFSELITTLGRGIFSIQVPFTSVLAAVCILDYQPAAAYLNFIAEYTSLHPGKHIIQRG
jgi:hypothetical protein